jgi:hypothetical protein
MGTRIVFYYFQGQKDHFSVNSDKRMSTEQDIFHIYLYIFCLVFVITMMIHYCCKRDFLKFGLFPSSTAGPMITYGAFSAMWPISVPATSILMCYFSLRELEYAKHDYPVAYDEENRSYGSV